MGLPQELSGQTLTTMAFGHTQARNITGMKRFAENRQAIGQQLHRRHDFALSLKCVIVVGPIFLFKINVEKPDRVVGK